MLNSIFRVHSIKFLESILLTSLDEIQILEIQIRSVILFLSSLIKNSFIYFTNCYSKIIQCSLLKTTDDSTVLSIIVDIIIMSESW